MEEVIIALYKRHFGVLPARLELLPVSGSARKYYRMGDGQLTYIGTYNQNVQENRLFIDFSRHFLAKGLHVPDIYAVSDDGLTYIQEDLGNQMLLDVVGKQRETERLSDGGMRLYQKALAELLRFQLLGGKGLNYSNCLPRPIFDRRCILWDLNYFKYCFLRLAGTDFSEQALENDFEELAACLEKVPTDSFMFRDFQSRNIMVRNDDVWFIDYQGGRQGALQYDVASLLYDAIVRIPDDQREELLDYYMAGLAEYRTVDRGAFRKYFYCFVLIRLLQAMGAFGLRGLYEKKQHFIDSIRPGLQSILALFAGNKFGYDYPEIRRAIENSLKSAI